MDAIISFISGIFNVIVYVAAVAAFCLTIFWIYIHISLFFSEKAGRKKGEEWFKPKPKQPVNLKQQEKKTEVKMSTPPKIIINRRAQFVIFPLVFVFFLFGTYVLFTHKAESQQYYLGFWGFLSGAILTPLFFLQSLMDKSDAKYGICPHCNMSILLIDKWQCRWCNSVQPSPVSFTLKCCECKRKQVTAHCEHCRKEFSL